MSNSKREYLEHRSMSHLEQSSSRAGIAGMNSSEFLHFSSQHFDEEFIELSFLFNNNYTDEQQYRILSEHKSKSELGYIYQAERIEDSNIFQYQQADEAIEIQQYSQMQLSLQSSTSSPLNEIENISKDIPIMQSSSIKQPKMSIQSKHKNVVKNIGLGFKKYIIDPESPLKDKIQQLLFESRLNFCKFRQWVSSDLKFSHKKEMYKALAKNISNSQSSDQSNEFKSILLDIFQIFFENSHAYDYIMSNKNIIEKETHIKFLKHFIESARNVDHLLKMWK